MWKPSLEGALARLTHTIIGVSIGMSIIRPHTFVSLHEYFSQLKQMLGRLGLQDNYMLKIYTTKPTWNMYNDDVSYNHIKAP